MKRIYENSSNEKQKFLSKNMYQKIFSILFEQFFLYILEKKAKKKNQSRLFKFEKVEG